MKLRDRVALVTGAASPKGLGFASGLLMAQEGAAVVLTDINAGAVMQRADAIVEQGGRCLGLGHDVSDELSWEKVMRTTLEAFGRLDILVNNAGIVIENPIDRLSASDFRKQLEVNLTGVFLGAAAAVRAMRAGAHGGSIINMSSVAGLVGFPALAGYNASKGGIRLMSKTIALEGAAEGIRCNSLHPGMIWTDMMQVSADYLVKTGQSPETLSESLLADVPMGWFGEPKDIANAVLFLASDDSRYVTGTELVVDGGMTAK